MATRQLRLLPPQEQPWKLDEHTKAVGRAGVAHARQALRPHAVRDADDPPQARPSAA